MRLNADGCLKYLNYLSQDYSRYSRNLLQTFFQLVQSNYELVRNEVAFVIAAFAAKADACREYYVAEFGVVECEV